MSKQCDLSQRKSKKGLAGNNVSHSKRRTRRRQEVNIQTKKFFDPQTGKKTKLKVSSRMLRTIAKNGLVQTLAKLKRKAKAAKGAA